MTLYLATKLNFHQSESTGLKMMCEKRRRIMTFRNGNIVRRRVETAWKSPLRLHSLSSQTRIKIIKQEHPLPLNKSKVLA